MIKKTIKLIYSLIMFFIAELIVLFQKFFLKDKSNIWLIAEQPHMARDNGIAFYDYCMEHNNNEIKPYYVVDFKCKDYEKIKYKSNCIKSFSLKHYIYYLKASVLIMAFPDGICPSVLLERVLRKIKIVKNKKVYLKHGIIKDDIALLHSDNFYIDMFITASPYEDKFIKENYGHEKNKIKLLGLSRYDYLEDKSTDDEIKILIMPTWRRWIKNDLKGTEYYKKYELLIESLTKKYHNKKNVKVLFYLHNNFQKFSNIFETNDVVKILTSKDYKVNELFNECNVMITDYSSVAFDFAYLGKPIIYYQFDYDEVIKKHYGKGYYDYERDGFGPRFIQESDIINYLDELEKNNYHIFDKYLKRASNFYKYRDKNNRERTYNEIKKLK